MILKYSDTSDSFISPFDLYGNNEVALSKAFAYLLSKDKASYNVFIKLLSVDKDKCNCRFKQCSIQIETIRKEGRTDIEISSPDLHIIIECKIKTNKLSSQLEQYIPSFTNVANKTMCFITQERESHKMLPEDIKYTFISWFDIISALSEKIHINNPRIQNFLTFAQRNYRMKSIGEILIQDLGNQIEINRFKNNHIYRRDVTFGTPLYFAPYYTRAADQPEDEGISYIAKVLGVLTMMPKDGNLVKHDLSSFTDDKQLIESWIKGIKLKGDDPRAKQTYYFLDYPLKLNTPLRKDKGGRRGSGKNWIALKIPKNRIVSFQDFLKHVPGIC